MAAKRFLTRPENRRRVVCGSRRQAWITRSPSRATTLSGWILRTGSPCAGHAIRGRMCGARVDLVETQDPAQQDSERRAYCGKTKSDLLGEHERRLSKLSRRKNFTFAILLESLGGDVGHTLFKGRDDTGLGNGTLAVRAPQIIVGIERLNIMSAPEAGDPVIGVVDADDHGSAPKFICVGTMPT